MWKVLRRYHHCENMYKCLEELGFTWDKTWYLGSPGQKRLSPQAQYHTSMHASFLNNPKPKTASFSTKGLLKPFSEETIIVMAWYSEPYGYGHMDNKQCFVVAISHTLNPTWAHTDKTGERRKADSQEKKCVFLNVLLLERCCDLFLLRVHFYTTECFAYVLKLRTWHLKNSRAEFLIVLLSSAAHPHVGPQQRAG